ncbi:MAG: molybdopterin-dependent oxidoreductase [Dehalococcoidales bacterium]|nr:molybdopterin-dependent oxidoreductase [Dehalococcoidales bacterium]
MEDLNYESGKNKGRQISRRDFLRNTGFLLTGTAITSFLFASACRDNTEGTETTESSQTVEPSDEVIYSSDTLRRDRIPPEQIETKIWPVLHEGVLPEISHPDWTLTISGLVENEKVLTYAEFTALPRVKVFSDVHCVTGWTKLNNLWEGVSSRSIVDLARIKPETKFVIVKSDYWSYSANLPLDYFLEEDVLFAVKHDEQDLNTEHGAPVRLVVPKLYFWKSVKWVTSIEFSEDDRPGYWETRGFHYRGDPWFNERYR